MLTHALFGAKLISTILGYGLYVPEELLVGRKRYAGILVTLAPTLTTIPVPLRPAPKKVALLLGRSAIAVALKLISTKATQLSKAVVEMLVRFSGIVMLVRKRHCENA